jgi:tetratricopeptide (TPR) repeat protein
VEYLIVLALIAAGLGIYAQTLGFGFITFDDPGYVYENPHVSHGLSWGAVRWAFTSFERSNWHPLTWLSLMADAQLYGLSAGGYHLTNLLLHLAAATTLFFWLRKATGAVWPSGAVALWFVIHPLHVESVVWVTERKDVLSALFFFLSLLAYTHYAQAGKGTGKGWFYAMTLAAFVMGLLAKPMLVTLPFVLLLLDAWPLKRLGGQSWDWRVIRARVLEKAPFFALAAASSWVTCVAQARGAMVPLQVLPLDCRLASAFFGCGAYLVKTFWPVGLGVYYPFWHEMSRSALAGWIFLLLALTAASLCLWKRLPWLWIGWAWFVGMLAPVVGVVQVGGQSIADRYTYLPHIGLFIAICWTADAAWRHYPAARIPLASAFCVVSSALIALGVRQAGYWRSSAALFEHTLAVTSPAVRLYELLGDAYLEENRLPEAEKIYRLEMHFAPVSEEVAEHLGVICLREGRWREAEALIRPWQALSSAPASLLNDYAFALVHLGRGQEAVAVYRRAIKTDPNYAFAHFGYANLLQDQGDLSGAAAQYAQALTINGDWPEALDKLAWISAHSDDPAQRHVALLMAQHAVDLTGRRDLVSLAALAAADAATGNWEQAVALSDGAYRLASAGGATQESLALCQERLVSYRARQLPVR